MRTRAIVTAGLLGLAARSAAAQEAVLLRFDPPAGEVVAYVVDVDAWLRSPAAAGDGAAPTVRIRLVVRRTATLADSAAWRYTEVTDSSSVTLPSFGGGVAAGADALRAMTTETAVAAGGREVSTRLVASPALAQAMPALVRGVVGIAISAGRVATITLPGRAVRPGDTWSDSLRYTLDRTGIQDGGGVDGAVIGRADFRLERLERRGDRLVAVIVATTAADAAAREPTVSATIGFTGSAIVEMDVEARRILRVAADITGSMLTRAGAVPIRSRLVQQAR